MNKKALIIGISIGVVAVAAAVVTPIVIYNVNKDKEISFVFADIKAIGPRSEGSGTYLQLESEQTLPDGSNIITKYEIVDDNYKYYSYVDGYDNDILHEKISNIYSDPTKDTPETTYHFEVVLPDSVTFTGAYIVGEFYSDKALTKKTNRVTYPSSVIKPLTILESVNEYYQITIDKIVFTYKSK